MPIYNGVLIFDTRNQPTLYAYIDAYLYQLSGFYYLEIRTWNSNKIDYDKTFQAVIEEKQLPSICKLLKDLNYPNINIHKVETIYLLL